MRLISFRWRLGAVTACVAVWTGATAAAMDTPLPAAERKIDFARDVRPILDESCVQCHAGDKRKGGFSINNRDSLLFGGENGRTVEPGDSSASKLIRLVASTDAEEMMPPKGDRLTAEQVGILRAWIDQGVQWPEGFSYAEAKEAKLAPRKPELPETEHPNPVDRILGPYLKEHGVTFGEPVTDSVFARRVYIDLIGLLPTPEQLATFESDPEADKRTRLVDALLDNRREYATHWLTFWNDALRNGYAGPGFIDNGRGQLTGWLFKSLYENKPYDQFVRELVDPPPGAGSEAFTKGIVWRGVVNSSQRPEMQAAQNLSQVFFGLNLKCASCHDSPISEWRLTDSYALASVFAEKPLELHRCDKPLGTVSEIGFIYPQLGTIDAAAPKVERQKQLAMLVTSPQNGRLSRTIVNRLWAQLVGRGIVEPVDEMDNKPWSADLLDFLAADLQDHGYDLKHTLRTICTSQAYQMASVGAVERREAGYVFRGPHVRRLTAEQYLDALSMLTGNWQEVTPAMLARDGRGQGGQLAEVRQVLGQPPTLAGNLQVAHWIWNASTAMLSDPGGRLFFRHTFTLETVPQRVVARASADNEFTLYVNGELVASGTDWHKPRQIDLTRRLRPGINTFAVEAINYPDRLTGKGLDVRDANPAGFILYAAGLTHGKVVWEIGSDKTWLMSDTQEPNWQAGDFEPKEWKPAAVVAPFNGGVWGLAARLAPDLSGDEERVRAALAMLDPLSRALGRPQRDQVVTRRDSEATTLQALELTNGQTLDTILKAGAERFYQSRGREGAVSCEQIYLAALGRPPSAEELSLARDVVGNPATVEGVHDLLWMVTMLPEFQLIQ